MKPLKLILCSSIALSIALASTTLAPVSASANQIASQVVISPISSINLGGTVTISGTSTNSEVIVKVIRPTGSVLFFDIVKVTNGTFTDSFVLGSNESTGTYKVVVGQADTVDTKDLIVTAPIPPIVTPPVTPPPPAGGGGGGGPSNIVTPGNVEISPNAIISNKVTGPDGKVTTSVTIDNKLLGDAFNQLKEQGKTDGAPVIAIKISNLEADGKTKVSIPASILLEGMKSVSNVVIRIYSDKESYSLPLQVLDLETIAKSLGADSSGVILHINISSMGTDIEKQIQESAGKKGATSLGHSVDFGVTAEGNGKTVELNNFGTHYVDRVIVYSGSIDPQTSTGILYDPTSHDISFVPTVFEANSDGTTKANIKRNGNSIYSVVTSSKSFDDIKGHWAKSDIELLASKMVVSGTTDTIFAPDHNITRAEFAALLVRSLALTSNAEAASFNDVHATDWFAGSIGAAVKAKLISGYEDGSFKPNAPITREQMAVMVAKALSAAGKTIESQVELLNKFNDNFKISDWAISSVSQSVKAGIISGMTDTTFVPSANASRAQAVVMLKRLLQYTQFIN
ncbi:S-layer homology domain-containing protein [Paenibacillus phytorum]|uniref:S-layer homology domain-containing protein n=1 Tax=Paenibacillus phytorum TaxID=2654977 RepID=UPI001492D20F|nr:S-layer homology domain-containing protein [Paenibacillus phytorum]